MTNAAASASERETINKVLLLLELSQAKEASYMNNMIQQIESMEKQINELNQQLNDMRTLIPQKKGIKELADDIYQKASEAGNDVRQALNDVIHHIAQKGREWLESMKQKGELKLYQFLDKIGLQEKLCAVQEKLNNGIETLEKGIQKLDAIENELRLSSNHMKNAVGIMTGKENTANIPNSEKSSNIFSKMLKSVQDIYKGMLDNVNDKIMAFERLENSVAAKNPSVLKKIGQYKNDTKENSGKKENIQNNVKKPEVER